MIAVPEHLEKPFLHLAECQHKAPDELLAQLIEDYIEELNDTLKAEQAIEELINGNDHTITLEELEKSINALDS